MGNKRAYTRTKSNYIHKKYTNSVFEREFKNSF